MRSDAAGVLHKVRAPQHALALTRQYSFRDIRLTVRAHHRSRLTTQDEAALVTASATAVKDAGTIRVSVRRLFSVTTGVPEAVTARKAFDPKPVVFRAPMRIHVSADHTDEASKKAQLKRSAGLAATAPWQGRVVQPQFIDARDKPPWFEVAFEYRFEALLEAQGIITTTVKSESDGVDLKPLVRSCSDCPRAHLCRSANGHRAPSLLSNRNVARPSPNSSNSSISPRKTDRRSPGLFAFANITRVDRRAPLLVTLGSRCPRRAWQQTIAEEAAT